MSWNSLKPLFSVILNNLLNFFLYSNHTVSWSNVNTPYLSPLLQTPNSCLRKSCEIAEYRNRFLKIQDGRPLDSANIKTRFFSFAHNFDWIPLFKPFLKESSAEPSKKEYMLNNLYKLTFKLQNKVA